MSDTMGVVLESVQVLLMDTRSRRRTSGVASSHFLTRVEIAKLNPTSLSHVVERMKGRSGGCTDPNVYMDGVPAFASEGAASSG
ncbi:MAG: hypothetical protein ABJB66_13525 [Gemmatimonadaceae bacterium]